MFSHFFSCLHVHLMVFISMIFTWFNFGYKHGYVTDSCHGYLMYLLVIVKLMDEIPNLCYNI